MDRPSFPSLSPALSALPYLPIGLLLAVAPAWAAETKMPASPVSTKKPSACRGALHLDERTPPPRPGERLEYELRLSGAYMGKLELSVGDPRKVEGSLAVPLFGRLRTNAFVSAIKPVRGRYMAMIDPQTLTPLGVRMEGKVGEDPRWEKVRFLGNGKEVETNYLYKGREKKRAYGAQHILLEGLSLLHLARRVPLEPGLVACQDVMSTRRLWRVHAQVIGRETVDTPAGPKPAYRVRTAFRRRPFRKKSKTVEIDVLLGDIPGRPPLAFEMTQNRFFGRARLVRWKPGRKG